LTIFVGYQTPISAGQPPSKQQNYIGFGCFLGGHRLPQKTNLLPRVNLVGDLEHFLFFHILGIVTPADELHDFSEG
jgi:hypothetical protein